MVWDVRKPAQRGEDAVESSPQAADRLIGRREDLEAAERLVRDGRLTTITGVRGIGKTTVARALQGALRDDPLRTIDKTVWLRCGGAKRPDDLELDAARAIGADTSKDGFSRKVGSDKTVLFLDDLESLLSADRPALRALFDRWLGSCPNLRLVVISRDLVGGLLGTGEQELRVGPLSFPESMQLFGAVAGTSLSEAERGSDTLKRGLEWLGGHPLALRLVAREARSWPIEALFDRLAAMAEHTGETSFFGEEPRRGATDGSQLGHFSAALSFSLDRLGEEEPLATEMFAWLGLFPRGMPVALAPIVFGEAAWDAAALLESSDLAINGDEHDRITLRPSFAELGRAKAGTLPYDRRIALLRRSFGGLSGHLSAMVARLPSRERPAALATLPREEAALDALTQALAAIPDTHRPTLDLSEHTVDPSPASAPAAAPDPALNEAGAEAALALAVYADLCLAADRALAAEPLVSRTKGLVAPLTSGATLARAVAAVGAIYARIDRLAEAEAAYREADALFAEIADEAARLPITAALATITARRGHPDVAERSLKGLLEQQRRRFDLTGCASTLRALGDLALSRDRPREAEKLYRTAIPLLHGLLDRPSEADALIGLGDAMRRYDVVAAEQAYRGALAAATATGERPRLLRVLSLLGEVLLQSEAGRAEASDILTRALGLARDLGDASGEATILATLADLSSAAGDAERAFERGLSALALRRRQGDSTGIAATYGLLSRIALMGGRPLRAVVLATLSHRIRSAMSDKAGELSALQDVGRALGGYGREDAESAAMIVAWGIAESIGHPFAAQMSRATSMPHAPPGLALEAQITLTAALSDAENELLQSGEDPTSPLTKQDVAPLSERRS